MGGGRRRRFEFGDPELDAMIEQLVARAQESHGESAGAEYARQMIVTALRLRSDGRSLGDLKLLTHALKELRHAFRVFDPYAQRRKVSVFGSARTKRDEPAWQQAFRFARRMTEHGWMTITGAGDGIMGAAQAGAGREASFGVNIRLPFEQQANPVIAGDPKLINFRYFFTRKVVFVKESHAVALFPGGYGTHDEGFEALTLVQTGKAQMMPIVCVDAPGGSYWRDWRDGIDKKLRGGGLIGPDDLNLFTIADDADEAVREIVRFYANYHSSRFVGDRLVIRLRQLPEAETLARLNEEFGDQLRGAIEVAPGPLRQEAGEFEDLPRLVLGFDRRAAGRLRLLIDRLNALVPVPEPPPLEAPPRDVIEGKLTPEQEREEEET